MSNLFNLPRRYQWMIGILAFTAFAPTLKLGFLWDDHVMIELNPSLRQWSVQNLKHDFTTDVFDHQGDAYYRPAQTLMNRVDFTIWGLRPFGFHLTNLLFHLANALLIAELVLALGALPLTAFITSSLFAVHPIVIEQLMIIAGRAELMGLFFSLIALLLFLKDDRRSMAWGWAAYVAAILSKESTVITPFLLALVFYARAESPSKYKRLIPMALVIVPYLWLRRLMVGPILMNANGWLAVRFFFQEFPVVIARYLLLILVPWNLHSHRLMPHINPFWVLSLLLFIGAYLYLIRRFKRPGAFCVGWFLLTLLPKTPVMIFGNFMLEHWAYPASLSVLLPIAWGINRGWHSRKESVRTTTAVLYFSLIIIWALLAHLNVALRGSDEKMYRWALNFTSSNPIKYNLGILLIETGRPAEAANFLEDVRAHYPEDSNALNALALAYWKSGHPWLAVRLLETFARIYPGDTITQTHLHQMKASLPKK